MEEILALIQNLAAEDGSLNAAALSEQISPLLRSMEDQLQNLQQLRTEEKRRFALAEALIRGGATDADYLLFKLAGRASYNPDGSIANADELLAKAKEEFPEFFSKRRRLSGVQPGEGDSGGTLAAEEFGRMGYRDRLKLFEDDPELYRSLQSMI